MEKTSHQLTRGELGYGPWRLEVDFSMQAPPGLLPCSHAVLVEGAIRVPRVIAATGLDGFETFYCADCLVAELQPRRGIPGAARALWVPGVPDEWVEISTRDDVAEGKRVYLRKADGVTVTESINDGEPPTGA